MTTSSWRADRWRVRHVLLALVVLHVLLKTVLYFRVWQTPYVGDETAYVDGARALSNLLRDLGSLQSPDLAELRRNVVGNGWFMPGMSVLTAPLFLLVPDAGVELVRAYVGVATTGLLLLAALAVRRLLGPVAAGAVLVFPGLVPMWLIFSFTAWGDACAGLLVVVLLAETVALVRRAVTGVAPIVRDGVRIGLLGIAALYFRSSIQPLLLMVALLLVLAVVLLLSGDARRRGLLAAAVAAAVFGGLLLPWSLTASVALDGRVLTTTSTPTSLANTFGDHDQVCFGPCDEDASIWFGPVRYARETARATGQSELDVLPQMSAYARADVTAGSYAADVLSDFGRYTMAPFGYEYLLRPPGTDADVTAGLVIGGTSLLYYPLLLGLLALLLRPLRGSLDLRLRIVLLELAVLALMIHPFVHVASTRYWPAFAPLMALAGVLLLEAARAGRTDPAPDAGPRAQRLSRLLGRVQVAISGGVLVVLGGLVVIAVIA